MFPASPNQLVMERLQHHRDAYCTCAIMRRELCYGWVRMPELRKKERIGGYLTHQRHSGLLTLSFDREQEDRLGCERAWLEKAGNIPAYAEAGIAAVAVTQKLVLVIRNTRDFRLFEGLSLGNWFSE